MSRGVSSSSEEHRLHSQERQRQQRHHHERAQQAQLACCQKEGSSGSRFLLASVLLLRLLGCALHGECNVSSRQQLMPRQRAQRVRVRHRRQASWAAPQPCLPQQPQRR